MCVWVRACVRARVRACVGVYIKGLLTEREVCTVKYRTEVFY